MADILKVYGSNLKMSGPFHAIPLQWLKSKETLYSPKFLIAIEEERYRVTLARKCYLAGATFLLIIFQEVLHLNFSSTISSDEITFWLLIVVLIASNCFLNFTRHTASQLAELINGLIQFDSMYPKEQKTLKETSIREILSNIMARAVVFSQYMIPVGAVFGLHWNNPWKSSLAMFWLIQKPAVETQNVFLHTIQVGTKLVVMFYNLWMWVFVMAGPGFTVGVLQNLSTTALIKNIET